MADEPRQHPKRMEYDIGRDRYGRPTTLIAEWNGGQLYWRIRSEPVNQRDEGEDIRSLTSDQLIAAGNIAGAMAHGR